MNGTVLFCFATGQMAPAISAVLASASMLTKPVHVVWLVDDEARSNQWMTPCAGVLHKRFPEHETIDIKGDLGFETARQIAAASGQ